MRALRMPGEGAGSATCEQQRGITNEEWKLPSSDLYTMLRIACWLPMKVSIIQWRWMVSILLTNEG